MLREEFLLCNRESIRRMAILLNEINRMPLGSLLAIAPENELIELKSQVQSSDWKISDSVLNDLIREEIKHLR